jgi:hypothetical protein
MNRVKIQALGAVLAVIMCAQGAFAQAAAGQGGRGGAAPAQTPRAAAPTDFTGYWVAVITEDWRWRMVTPPKGDTDSLPLTAEGRRVTAAWDLAKDVAAGEECKPFGAAGVMRMPTRLRISWQDDSTLKVETDNGTQTRLFHFDAAATAPRQPSWQGFSRARWETMQEGQGQVPFAGGAGGGQNGLRPGLSGGLRVDTTRMRPGYLRRNGVPYSGNATLTEYFDVVAGPREETWLAVMSIVEDPQYLALPLLLTTHFKREPDGSKFQPRPCEMTPSVPTTTR